MALLSCWGEVTTENEAEVVAANKRIHPQIEELLSVLSGILDAGRVEYWIDQGTLLGAYRHGKFIARDSDADIAIRNEEHFETLPDLFDAKLPCGYGWERKGDHCIGYRIWLKSGGNFKGSFKGKTIEWPLVVCDVMLYQFNETEEAYVQKYQGFGVDSCFYSEDVVFPLDRIEFEGKAYPCPAQVKEYLEIQYGYIGEGAVWVAEANRWAKG